MQTNENSGSVQSGIKLPERVVVIGLGGIGSVVARYLSVFLDNLPSEHTLVLVDGDKYEIKNKDRQVFSEMGFKADVVAEELENFCDSVLIESYPHFIGEENWKHVLREGSLVLSCVDHHGVRSFISEKCELLENVTLISGGNDGVEDGKSGTYGNIQLHVRRDSEDISPPITAFHPEIAQADRSNAPLGKQGCSVILDSVPQVIFTNVSVASMMLNAVYAHSLDRDRFQEVHVDILECKMQPQEIVKLTKALA